MFIDHNRAQSAREATMTLRDARDRTGLTQRQLAAHLECSTHHVSKMEQGIIPAPARYVLAAEAIAWRLHIADSLLRWLNALARNRTRGGA